MNSMEMTRIVIIMEVTKGINMKLRDIDKLLERNGFILVRSTKHRVYAKGSIRVVVPMHKEVNKMIAKKIIKEIELTQLQAA